MRPILFHVGSLPIQSHSVFAALGIAVALTMSWTLARRHRRDAPELIWIIAGGLMGGAFFAHYGMSIRYLHDADAPTLAGLIRYGGRSVLGGLAGAYAGVVLTKRLIGYRRHTGDLFAPGVALGIAIGRIGCHLAETPGTATTLRWGVRVAPELATRLVNCVACQSGARMHPSFLYESVFLTALSWWLWPRAQNPSRLPSWMGEGDVFKLFLLAYALFRFAVEFVRGNPALLFDLSGSQLMVLPASLALLSYFVQRYRRFHAQLSSSARTVTAS